MKPFILLHSGKLKLIAFFPIKLSKSKVSESKLSKSNIKLPDIWNFDRCSQHKPKHQASKRIFFYLDTFAFWNSVHINVRRVRKQRWHRKRITEPERLLFLLIATWVWQCEYWKVWCGDTEPSSPISSITGSNTQLKPKLLLCKRLRTVDRDWPGNQRLIQIWVKNIQYFHTAFIH